MSDTYEYVRFTLHADRREAFLAERPAAIAAVRAAFPGLLQARLVEHDDGSWSDHVLWRSREEAERAAAEFTQLPAVRQWVSHIDQVREISHGVVRHAELPA